LLVRGLQILANDERPNKGLDKPADAPRTDDDAQSVIDALVNGNGQLLLHGSLHEYVLLHVYSIMAFGQINFFV